MARELFSFNEKSNVNLKKMRDGENPDGKHTALDSGDLRQIIKKAGKGTSHYDALKNAGVICNSTELD